MQCISCGKELNIGAKFCTGCGTPVVPIVPSAPQTQPPAPKPPPAKAPVPKDPWAPREFVPQPPPGKDPWQDSQSPAPASGAAYSPHSSPLEKLEQLEPRAPEHEHGGCLIIFLAVGALLNGGLGLWLLANSATIENNPQSIFNTGGHMPVAALGAIALIQAASAVLIFLWKKLGVYIFVGCQIGGIALQSSGGLNPRMIIMGLISLGILFYLVKDEWDMMK
jgi:hypothetical protein